MDRVFEIELCNGKLPLSRPYTTLRLPASPYMMVDAMEKAQLTDPHDAEWEIVDCEGFEFLSPHLSNGQNLLELNALAQKLAELDVSQLAEFEGLCKIEANRYSGEMNLLDLIDLAHSTDACHLVPVYNDLQLGKFYAENGFVAEVDNISDELFELLNFEKIGKKMRLDDGGVFTSKGYVLQHAPIVQIAKTMDFSFQPPEYLFRIGVKSCAESAEKIVYLELPTTIGQFDEIPRRLGLEDWAGTMLSSFDGVLPNLDITSPMDLEKLNELARRIQKVQAKGELPKFKALLNAADCADISSAITLSYDLDEYQFNGAVRTHDDVGMTALKKYMADSDAQVLQQYLNVFAYGVELIDQNNAVLTDYGFIQRKDGQKMQLKLAPPAEYMQMGGMTMN